jgi:RES domain-containing protein
MVEQATLENILASASKSTWTGSVFRVMLNDFSPERENTVGARWNPPGIQAIYTCLEPSVCIAEIEHHLGQQPRPVRPDLRRTLYQIEVSLSAVLDLGPLLPALAEIGINQAHLHADDMQVSQGIGRLVTWLGCDGLLVPSARKAGHNLVIYPAWAGESYRFDVVDRKPL